MIEKKEIAKDCDGLEVTCHWAASTICIDCLRFEKFSEKERHWGAIKDWFITPEAHMEDIKRSMQIMGKWLKY